MGDASAKPGPLQPFGEGGLNFVVARGARHTAGRALAQSFFLPKPNLVGNAAESKTEFGKTHVGHKRPSVLNVGIVAVGNAEELCHVRACAARDGAHVDEPALQRRGLFGSGTVGVGHGGKLKRKRQPESIVANAGRLVQRSAALSAVLGLSRSEGRFSGARCGGKGRAGEV